MSSGTSKCAAMTPEDEEKINYLIPDIVLAVESLQLATPERIHQCLEECDIKITSDQMLLALEYGCKLGLMEERTRYRLNPELCTRKNCFVECKAPCREMPPCCTPKEKKKELEPDPCEEEEPLPSNFNGPHMSTNYNI